jgi:hypothetical protein
VQIKILTTEQWKVKLGKCLQSGLGICSLICGETNSWGNTNPQKYYISQICICHDIIKELKIMETPNCSNKNRDFTVVRFVFQPLHPWQALSRTGCGSCGQQQISTSAGNQTLILCCPASSLVTVLLIITWSLSILLSKELWGAYYKATSQFDVDRWEGDYSLPTIITTNW